MMRLFYFVSMVQWLEQCRAILRVVGSNITRTYVWGMVPYAVIQKAKELYSNKPYLLLL